MKPRFITLIILVISLPFMYMQAQTTQLCDCKAELDFLTRKMEDMISYKKQVKGENSTLFQKTYQSLSGQMFSPITKEDCLFKLNTLLSVVKDKHAKIESSIVLVSNEEYKDSVFRANFKTSNIYKEHPKVTIDIIKLKTTLAQKSFEDIEGIYVDKYVGEIGVYRTDVEQELIAVVLEPSSSLWGTGQIAYRIKELDEDEFQVLRYHPISRKLWFQKSMLYFNGKLWGLQKQLKGINYTEVPSENSNWEFRQLNKETQYLYFGSFSNRKSNVADFKAFYAANKDKINAPNVIVDLRDNGGGNSKYSDPFVKILKKSGAKVYIITNYFTGSNAEQFTLKLRKLKNAVHLGQRTQGIITYGFNYGTGYDSPSGLFTFYPTDMNFHRFIDYEMVGIAPEILLDFDKDWIEQTLDIINR